MNSSASPLTSARSRSKPPRQLKDVFDRVTTAVQNRSKLLNDAHGYENQVTNNASAQAAAVTNEAATASANYVKYAQADAKRFNDLLPQYRANPELFVQFYVSDTMRAGADQRREMGAADERQWQNHRTSATVESRTAAAESPGESVNRKWTRRKNEEFAKWQLHTLA